MASLSVFIQLNSINEFGNLEIANSIFSVTSALVIIRKLVPRVKAAARRAIHLLTHQSKVKLNSRVLIGLRNSQLNLAPKLLFTLFINLEERNPVNIDQIMAYDLANLKSN